MILFDDQMTSRGTDTATEIAEAVNGLDRRLLCLCVGSNASLSCVVAKKGVHTQWDCPVALGMLCVQQ